MMPLPIRYSVQPSTLIPDGFTGDYGRLQVDQREQTNTVIISATDYDAIVLSLKEGKLVGMKDATGRDIGQLQLGLAGGFNVSTFNGATVNDMRISFKPTQDLLADIRSGATFQQIAPVIIRPVIHGITYTMDNGGNAPPTVLINQIQAAYPGVLTINGINFIKDDIRATINLPVALILSYPVSSGTKFATFGISHEMIVGVVGAFTIKVESIAIPSKVSATFNIQIIA
jgi:ribosomal protein S19